MLSKFGHKIYRLNQFFENPKAFYLWLRHRIDPELYFTLVQSQLLEKFNINTVIDVGAYKGKFSTVIRNLKPNVSIYAFEPLEEPFKELQKVALSLGNIKAYNYALSDSKEYLPYFVNAATYSSSFLKLKFSASKIFPKLKEEETIKIEVQRLDDVIEGQSVEENILIKVDVQGFENKVLRGGTKTFRRATVVIIETMFVDIYEDQSKFETIFELLKSMGFSYSGSFQDLRLNGLVIFEDSLFIRV